MSREQRKKAERRADIKHMYDMVFSGVKLCGLHGYEWHTTAGCSICSAQRRTKNMSAAMEAE